MRQARSVLRRLLFPPKQVLCALPPIVFSALVCLFALGDTKSPAAYLLYFLSAYALTILIAGLPRIKQAVKRKKDHWKQTSRLLKKVEGTALGSRYLHDRSFRESVSLYQSMALNFLYVLFRVITGICHPSLWLVTLAVYYLLLGALRANLIFSYRKAQKLPEANRLPLEYRCYRRTGCLLLLLNLLMGVMVWQMVMENSAFSYPGAIIYLSALYTFLLMSRAVVDLVKFRKQARPILSAAKILNLVAGMMSVLGLQTALISRFSKAGEESFRFLMNALVGSAVYLSVIVTAAFMLLRSLRGKSCPPGISKSEETL